jgi:hypothetical protein
MWTWLQLMPVFGCERPFINFAHQLRDDLPVKYREHWRYVGSRDPRLIWYGDLQIPRVMDPIELLEMQEGQRSLAREKRIVGEAIAGSLAGDELALFVAHRPDYIEFLIEAPRALAERGEPFREPHLWMQTTVSKRPDKHFVLFGNQPPPWSEPELDPPSKRLIKARQAQGATQPATDRATTQPATRPANE